VDTDSAATAASAERRPHLVLIDGSGYIFRAFHALPAMTRPDGTPVGAVFGFTNMLAKLLREHTGSHLGVVFDAGATTFRNRLFGDYKAHRPEPPPDLVPQFALVREATRAFGVTAIELDDWEADDLIASYARAMAERGGQVTIVSSDKDFMQLLRDGVAMLDPIKQKPIGPAEVLEKFGVRPDKMIDLQALMGDSVDNVPGVPGVGPKNAAQLLDEHGDLEAILAAAPSMKPSKRRDMLLAHAEAARLSRQLVALRDDAPLPHPLDALATREPDRDTLGGWLLSMGFRSTANRLGLATPDGRLAAAAATAPASTAPVSAALASAAGVQASLALPEPSGAPFGHYVCLFTLDELQAWCAEAVAAGMAAISIESEPRSRLVGLSLATAPGRACYVPLRHAAAQPIAPDAALAALGPLLTDPRVLKIFADEKAAQRVLTADGAKLAAPADDVMLISYAMEAGRHGHMLEELAALHLGHRPVDRDQLTGTGRSRLALSQLEPERVTLHAAERADIVLRLWQMLRPRLRQQHALALYEQVDRRLSPVLLAMEQAGIRVDADDLRAMSADFSSRMAAIEKQIFRLAGEEFNLGSAKQLGEVLFDRMGLSGGKRMKTGAWGTDASVLQSLAEQGHELPSKVLEWRQLAKLKSTYADALVDEIDPATGRVHTCFAMAVASTGRLSSNDPNLQNIPIRTEEGQRIRHAFVAAPGNLLVSADYSQIELRLLAHVADIPPLRDSFLNGEDIHARTASEVFSVPMEGMDSATRRRAKAINFGIIYGISAFGLGRQLGIEAGLARAYIDAYFARYPGIRTYMQRTREEARINGFVLTPFGRRCWIPGIADRNPAARGYAERQAINAPLQGGAADIIKRAMVRLPAALHNAGLTSRLLLQVHDELLFEAPEAEAEALAAVARQVMENAANLWVPLVVETGQGKSWSEAH
jgi:DNA polymerase-1